MSDHLVSTQWLADHLSAPDVVVVDASWYLPAQNRNARAEYAEGHSRARSISTSTKSPTRRPACRT